jgi:DNA-binding transcriptional regulator YbjK
MDAAAVSHLKPAASELLLAHCSALETEDRRRSTVAARLEALLGSELAKRLVTALSSRAS